MVEEGAGSMPGPMVERLTRSAKGELTQALTEAFAQHPVCLENTVLDVARILGIPSAWRQRGENE